MVGGYEQWALLHCKGMDLLRLSVGSRPPTTVHTGTVVYGNLPPQTFFFYLQSTKNRQQNVQGKKEPPRLTKC